MATEYVGSGPLGRDSGTAQYRTLPVTGPWEAVWSCTNQQFVAASAGPGRMQEGPSCIPRLAFTSTRTGSRSAKVLRHPKKIVLYQLPQASTYQLPNRLSHGKSLWVYSSIRHKLHREKKKESRVWGYCFPPGTGSMKGNASSKKADGVCGMRKLLSTGILVSVPSAYSPEP